MAIFGGGDAVLEPYQLYGVIWLTYPNRYIMIEIQINRISNCADIQPRDPDKSDIRPNTEYSILGKIYAYMFKVNFQLNVFGAVL